MVSFGEDDKNGIDVIVAEELRIVFQVEGTFLCQEYVTNSCTLYLFIYIR